MATAPDPLRPRDLTIESVAEARALQERLRPRLEFRPPSGFAPRLAAGADVSVVRGRDTAYAAVVVVDMETLGVVDEACAALDVAFPYVPGLLSFRELPPLAAAWERLRVRPDVILFDAHGYAHPRRFGLACHGGVLFDTPSIGCAKSILVGEVQGTLGEERGAWAPLVDEGEVVGRALRTRRGARPVFVSVGHRMDLDTATALVLRLAPRYRLPETTRRSHGLVGRQRQAAARPGAGTAARRS